MIRYRLICSQEHEFEAWFKDSAGYERQVRRHQVSCPHCGDVDVSKAIMAPGLKSAPAEGIATEAQAHEVARRILAAVGKLKDTVETDYDYVGESFADEARAIHHGEAEERGIWGEATSEDAEELLDEGIPVLPLPGVSRRRDN